MAEPSLTPTPAEARQPSSGHRHLGAWKADRHRQREPKVPGTFQPAQSRHSTEGEEVHGVFFYSSSERDWTNVVLLQRV